MGAVVALHDAPASQIMQISSGGPPLLCFNLPPPTSFVAAWKIEF
jgi:hypothetical protein